MTQIIFNSQEEFEDAVMHTIKEAFKAGWLCRADRRTFMFEQEAENYVTQFKSKIKTDSYF